MGVRRVLRFLRSPARWPRPGRRLLLTVVVAGVLGTLIVGGIGKLQIKTGVDSFVPAENPTVQATAEVASAFGGDPVVVLLESDRARELLSGEQLRNLLRLEGELAKLPDAAAVYGPATVLNQVAGQAQRLLAELTGYRDGLRAKAEGAARAAGASKAEVAAAGERATAEFDRRYGSLLAQGLPGGLPTLHNDRFVQNVVFNDAGDPRPQWHFVVPSKDAIAILVRPRQGLSQDAVEHLVGKVRGAVDGAELDVQRVTVSGIPTVVSAMGKQVRQEIPILGGIALLAVGAWFLLVRWTRWRRRILPLLATLTGTGVTFAAFGWLGQPVSLGAVAFLPVLLGVGSDFMTYLHRRVGRRVVVATALATAASFGALAVMPIPAVRELGITLAAGIVVSLVVSLLVALRVPHGAVERRPAPRGLGRGIPGTRGVRIAACAVGVVAAVAGWVLLPTLPLKADFQGFAADLPVLEDARHAEKLMGSSGELAITLTGQDTVSQESLDWMRRAQDAVIAGHGDELRPVLSPPTLLRFLGSTPTPDQLESALRLVPRYLTTSVVRSDQGMSILSFGVHLDDAVQLRALRDDIREILPPPPEGIDVAITGLPMVAVSGYESISGDRYLTAGLGIVAATVVLLVALRRRTDALRAMAAAVMATGLVLLGMALGGIGLNPLTAAVGSLTAAVACEFTVVLTEGIRRRDTGIRRAVLLAAAASATGYAALAFSELAMIRAFGTLLAVTVGVSVLAAQLVVWLTSRTARDDDLAGVASENREENKLVGATR